MEINPNLNIANGVSLPAYCGIAPVAPHSLSIYDVSPPAPSLPSPTSSSSTTMAPSDAEDPLPSHTECSPARRKLIHATRGNLWFPIKRYKKKYVLFIAVTFQCDNAPIFDSLTAQRRLQSAIPLFDRLFVAWIFVLELNPRPHYHGIAVCRQDIRRGWNQLAYARMVQIQDDARSQRRPLTPSEHDVCRNLARSLTTNANLQSIFRAFRDELPSMGFREGHPAHASPIQYPRRCINYIIKDLDKPTSDYPSYRRGTSLVLKSTSIVWPYSKDFGWNTAGAQKLRIQKTKITTALHVDGEQGIVSLLGGKNWHSRLMTLVGALNSEDYQWPDKPHDTVEDAIIRVMAGTDANWATNLANELITRRLRHSQGLPDD